MTPPHLSYGPTFRPYDRLTDADLTQWQQVPLFAAARHFHGLHRLYGVADGLTVRLTGNKVSVEDGVAFDAYGRPLLWFSTPILEPVSNGDWIILQGQQPVEQGLHIPVPAPQPCQVVVRKPSNGRPPDINLWDVPLATLVQQQSGRLEPDLAVRPVAVRAFRRPYVATGTVPSGTTAVMLPDGTGWQLWVDTRMAGFLRFHADRHQPPPVYLVTVGQQTEADTQRLRDAQVTAASTTTVPTRAPLVTVSQARHDGFLLTVEYDRPMDGLQGLAATPLVVRWVGVEQRTTDGGVTRTLREQTEDIRVAPSTVRRQLPWPEFRDGQRLTAPDLNDLQQTLRELQWLHNKTLHEWGIAEGFEVTALPARRGVTVQPGYALDVKGRELILSDPRQLTVPALPVSDSTTDKKTWWLAASYEDVQAPRDGDPSCRLQGVPLRRLPEARVRWCDPDEARVNLRLEPGYDVILATVELERGEVVAVTTVGRRSAVPPKRPYLYASRKDLTRADLTADRDPQWLKATINTAAAGFVNTPHYLFTLEWDKQRLSVADAAQPVVTEPLPTQFSLALPSRWFGDDTPEQQDSSWFWCFIIVMLLLAALGFQLLANRPLAWTLSVICGVAAALPTLLAAFRKKPVPSRPPRSTVPPASPSWETTFKDRMIHGLNRLVPWQLFRHGTQGQGISRWWLLATAGLPLPMVLVHLFPWESTATPPWIWVLSFLCAAGAALPSILTAWQAATQPPPPSKPTQGLKVTIAWLGIEV